MRAQLLHLSGPLRGRTIIYPQHRVVLGSDPSAEVVLEGQEIVRPRHAELTFFEDSCDFHLKALQGEVFVNQRQIREVVLEQQDLVEIGRGGPKFRFFVHLTPGKVCKPVRRMLTDARDVGTSSGFRAFTQTIRRDLIHHATPQLKIGMLLTLLAAVFVVSYVGGWLGGQETTKRERDLLKPQEQKFERAIAGVKTQIEEYVNAELEKLKKLSADFDKLKKLSEEFDKKRLQDRQMLVSLRADLDAKARVLDGIIKENVDFKKVLEVYTKGVCLLHGRYTFKVEKDGKMVPVLDGDGDSVEIEYVGSGFLADKDGRVVTNRHVAQPWWHNAAAERLLKKGLKPEFISLTCVFPGKPPIQVDTENILLGKDEVDLASFSVKVTGVPYLPLHAGRVGEQRGRRVVLVGYPTGMQAIIARADPETMSEVMDRASDMTTLIVELAKRNIISPIITQGRLNEVNPNRLVYDAETTSGGSGGPVFGGSGDVIGVNFAITRDFDGSNFGVPVDFVHKLLEDK